MPIDLSKRVLITGGGAAALGLGSALWLNGKNSNKSLDAKHPLAGLMLPDAAGKMADLTGFTKRPVLINFWATWCSPCIEELPLFSAFYRENGIKNIQLLGIAIDKVEAVQRFLTKIPLSFPTAIAGFEGLNLVKALGNTSGGLPYTVIVSSKSEVLFAKSGQIDTDELNKCLPLLL